MATSMTGEPERARKIDAGQAEIRRVPWFSIKKRVLEAQLLQKALRFLPVGFAAAGHGSRLPLVRQSIREERAGLLRKG